jgi:putative OPT family oligopeptide transporter
MDFSPALLAAGFIVGINVAISMLLGIIIAYGVLLPTFAMHTPLDLSHLSVAVHTIYADYLRYVGVGTLLIAGVWTVLNLIKPIGAGIRKSIESMRERKITKEAVIRTERDLSLNYVVWGTLAALIPVSILLCNVFKPEMLGISQSMFWLVIAVALSLVLVVGFVVSSVSGYFAGMVGTSNSPLSSMTIVAAILIALALSLLMGTHIDYKTQVNFAHEMAALVIVVVAVVCCSAAITNDTIQDLKAGQMVGATPWKQQVMLILGVVSAALVIPAILELLFQAYGIAGVYPREGMDPNQMLAAPQATLVATISLGMFGGHVKWGLIFLGIAIGVVCIVIDELLKLRGTRLPVIGVGSAIYLPLSVTTTFALGGFVSYAVKHALHRRTKSLHNSQEHVKISFDRVTLLACGLVAGASLMGVILAIPFAISKSTDILAIMPASLGSVATLLSMLAMVGLIYWIYQTAVHKRHFK